MRLPIMCFLALSLLGGVSHAETDPADVCATDLAKDPRFAPIAKKLPLARNSTFEMLADQSFPSAKERKAISKYFEAYKECSRAGEAYRQQHYPPQIAVILNEMLNNVFVLATELYNKKISYGNFNVRTQAIHDDARNKVTAIVQQMKSQIEAQQQAQRRAEQARQEAQRQTDEARSAFDQLRDHYEQARQEAQRQAEAVEQAAQREVEQAQQNESEPATTNAWGLADWIVIIGCHATLAPATCILNAEAASMRNR